MTVEALREDVITVEILQAAHCSDLTTAVQSLRAPNATSLCWKNLPIEDFVQIVGTTYVAEVAPGVNRLVLVQIDYGQLKYDPVSSRPLHERAPSALRQQPQHRYLAHSRHVECTSLHAGVM